MSFKNMFRENYAIMKEALETDNVAALSGLVGKKISLGSLLVQHHLHLDKMSPEMARVLVRDMKDADWEKWGFKEDSRDTICRFIFFKALLSDRTDLMDVFTGGNIVMNPCEVDSHPFKALCVSKISEDAKRSVLAHMLAQGIDKVKGRDTFLKAAAVDGFIAGFDAVKPRIDVDIHSDNEHMLRHAAGAGQVEMCLHLVQKYGADIDVALITERTLGHQKAAETLEEARAILKPEAKPAPSIAGLAAQVQTLERTVAELQANMRDITARLDTLLPEKRLDKRLAPQPVSRA